jgi:hypothetical protein
MDADPSVKIAMVASAPSATNWRTSASDARDKRFTEWSRPEPSDMAGQVERPSEQERASQTPYKSFAPGFHCRDFRQIGWHLARGKSFDVHFDQAGKWATEVRFRLAASVDYYANRSNDTTVRTDDVDRFLDAAAARDDIFDHDKSFLRRNLKTATQGKFTFHFFYKNVTLA